MKSLIKHFLVLTVLAGFVGVGCSNVNESFTDGFRDNPNNPTDAPADKAFIAGQTAGIMFHEGHSARLGNMWTQHYTGEDRQYRGFYNYQVANDDFGTEWFLAYTRTLTNLRLAITKAAEEGGKENLTAVAKINEGLLMGTVASLWGAVPYSEAVSPEQTFTPAYDPQSDVYASVQSRLDEAISFFESTPRSLPSGVDAYSYNGNATQWLKAAYTLKARFYMHVGDYSSALSAAQNGIDDPTGGDDLFIPHGPNYQKDMNLWHSFIVFDRSAYLGAGDNNAFPLMEQKSNRSGKTDETGRQGFYYDLPNGNSPNVDDGAFAADADYALIRYAENELIMAEAEARASSAMGDAAWLRALDHLNNARSYNENVYGGTYEDLTATDFAAGGDYEDITLLQEILDETYLTLNSSLEAFNFSRRIDYQVTAPGTTSGFLEPIEGNALPERFLYTDDEINANPNVPEPIPGFFDPTPVNN